MPAQPTKGARQTALFQGVGFIQRPRHLGLWRPSTSPAQFPPLASRRINLENVPRAKHPRISGPSSASPRAAECAERSSAGVAECTPPVGSDIGERQLRQDGTPVVLIAMSPETPAKPSRVGLSSVGAMEGRVVPDTQDRSKAVISRIGESSGNVSVLTAPPPVEGTRLGVTDTGHDICSLGSSTRTRMGSVESSTWGSEADPDSQYLLSCFRDGVARRALEKPQRTVSVGGWSAAGNDPG